MLKQVLTIPEIKTGILFQGKVVGIRNAYNVFCEEQEKAIHLVGKEAMENRTNDVGTDPDWISSHERCDAFLCQQTIGRKTIELEVIYLDTHKEKPMNKRKLPY